jgi:hypothetical protein
MLATGAVLVGGCAPSTKSTRAAPDQSPLASVGARDAQRRVPKTAGKPGPAHPIPRSFGSPTDAPRLPANVTTVSPGAPSDAQIRHEVAQLERYQRRLKSLTPVAADFGDLMPWALESKIGRVSVASVFTDYGLGLACGGLLARDQLGVAHKTAPCGTIVDFTYAGRTLRLPVIDRGPYIPGREWDLTGAAAQVLHFPGLGLIGWSVEG